MQEEINLKAKYYLIKKPEINTMLYATLISSCLHVNICKTNVIKKHLK